METPVKSKINPETYIIREGTILYRGDTPFYITNKDVQSRSLEQKPTFFGLEPNDVKQYGIIHSWTVPQDIELLHLDNPDVMKSIYNEAPERVKDVLEKNYGYNPKKHTIGNSKSFFERDRIFYEYLCTTRSPGYASTRYEGEEISSYEVMVCNPTNFVFSEIVLPSGVKDEPSYIDEETKKYYERINPKEVFGKKRKPQESVFSFNKTSSSNLMAFPSSPVEYSQVEYSSEGQVMYSPLRISKGKDSPIKMNTETLFDSPVKGALFDSPVKRALFDSPVKGALFHSPVKGALFPSPKKGGSKKRKVMKTRKSKRGKPQSRKSRSK